MKFMRRTEGYTLLDNRRNDILEELKVDTVEEVAGGWRRLQVLLGSSSQRACAASRSGSLIPGVVPMDSTLGCHRACLEAAAKPPKSLPLSGIAVSASRP